jgi:hypothetical protein
VGTKFAVSTVCPSGPTRRDILKLQLSHLAAAVTLTVAASTASAVPILLESQSVRVNITDRGVFSSLRYDPTGTGTFPGDKDYVSPGIPFEGFEVRATTATGGPISNANSNSGGQAIAGTTAVAAGAFDYGAQWTGGNNFYELTHLFFFNAGDERVNIVTTLTALVDLSGVRVSRAVDPDPDNYPGGSASTENQRGIAAQSISVNDFVGSLGSISGYPLGLFYSGVLEHNSGIMGSCCSVTNPDSYLAGGDQGDSSSGDHGIGLGFNLGDMTSGQTISWTYAYVMGGSLDTIDIPGEPGTPVPVPATLLLAGLGLLGVARSRRSRA